MNANQKANNIQNQSLIIFLYSIANERDESSTVAQMMLDAVAVESHRAIKRFETGEDVHFAVECASLSWETPESAFDSCSIPPRIAFRNKFSDQILIEFKSFIPVANMMLEVALRAAQNRRSLG